MRASFVLRVRILSFFAILAALLLLVRLYFIQIVHHDEYRAAGMGQYVEPSDEEPKRGDIFFTKKNGDLVAAAVMQGGWRIAINPKLIENPTDVYTILNKITPMDKVRFDASVAKKKDPYEEVAFRIDDDAAEAVREQKITGVSTVRDEWRFYPAGTLAAHIVGFVGYKGDTKAGITGLERYWEDTLRIDSGGLYMNPFAEIFTNVKAMLATDPASQKGSIVTTIEPAVQDQVEKSLDRVMEAYSPKRAGAIIMDPSTGAIIAMAMRPSFDPNTYNLVTNPSTFTNSLVEGSYELGSIMKPLTMAAAIDVGAVTSATTYDDKGCIMKSGAKICNFDGKGRGVVSMQEVLNQSLNTGVSFAVDQMGHSTFAEYLKKYGLGEETGIDVPGEVSGNIFSVTQAGAADVDFASASFGQSIGTTPIQMIRALAVLANQGKLPEPHIVKSIRNEVGIDHVLTQPDEKQVIKPATAETVTSMLVKVYDDALLAGELKQEHYSIAAKTGTAQIAIPGGGGYYGDRYLHSFFGYFPAHDPKFIVFLYAVEPQKEMYASHTLAHPFGDIAAFIINYYNIPPDR